MEQVRQPRATSAFPIPTSMNTIVLWTSLFLVLLTIGGPLYYSFGPSIIYHEDVVSTATIVSSATPDPTVPGGYWTAYPGGMVTASGGAHLFGDLPSVARLNRPIVGIASTPDGGGYWLVASDGGIFSFGDAQFHGSTGNLRLNRPIVGIAATPDGGGYWLVASDGGIFSFGDAQFYGSTGNLRLNRPIVGIAATPDGGGYWLVASDGGIFSFGDAQFHGSTGNLRLNRPIVGIAATPDGGGYWLVASDGGIFSFGDAQFHGSLGSTNIAAPAAGIFSQGIGYSIVLANGGITTFGGSIGSTAPLPAFGVNLSALQMSSTTWMKAIDEFSTEGATWVRIPAYWNNFERSPGQWTMNYISNMQSIVRYASSRGMRVLFTVLGTPAWAQPSDGPGSYNNGINLPPTEPEAYAQTLALMAENFNPSQVAWELWNEPNYSDFFTGSAQQYVTLACDAYRAIMQVQPSATVVGGAVSDDDSPWLSEALSAGLGNCMNVFSLHPYVLPLASSPDSWTPPVEVSDARHLLVSHGLGSMPIWITEIGWSANPDRMATVVAPSVSLQQQASYLVSYIQEVGARYSYVTNVMVYDGIDSPGSSASDYSGLMSSSFEPKLAYYALSNLYHGFPTALISPNW